MKSDIKIILSIFLILFGCEKDSYIHETHPSIDGLSLYWDHDIFGTEGRRTRFEFYGTKQFDDSYDLIFKYSINQNNISISLVDEIDNGKCQKIESGWGNDSLCTPRGRMYLPDSLLSKGTYNLILKTPNFETTSELVISNDSISLNIPSNEHFSCSIHAIYPIPLNLLFGYIVYSGVQNTETAKMFLNDLLTLGLTKTNVPYYPYRYLSVDKDGTLADSSWPPDSYSIGLLYTLNHNFKDVVNLAKGYFDKTNINISLYSSNGDQALLSKIDGITIVYAK